MGSRISFSSKPVRPVSVAAVVPSGHNGDNRLADESNHVADRRLERNAWSGTG